MEKKKSEADKGGSVLSVVGDDEQPLVTNEGSILALARRFGELAPKLPVFEVNGDLVYYDHRRERRPMTGRVFRSWIESHVMVVGGFDRRTGAPQPGSLNLSDSTDVLVAPAFLRGVRRIEHENKVRMPVLREDGCLDLLPWGYDEHAGVYTVPEGLEYDCEWDVTQGKKWIKRWFGSFPFAEERSLAVLVAGLLVLYVRHLPGGNSLRPGFLFEANRAGSGKSLLGKACCSIVLGFAPVGKRKSKEEMDKEIEAYVKSKSPVIFLDNLYGSLKSSTLDQLVTSKVVAFRQMGGLSMATLRNDAPLILTGNDLEKNEDAWRRYLQCQLFEPGDPNQREVPELLDDTVMESEEWRSDALSALWSIVSVWHSKGMPKGEAKLGSFEAFSELMGGIVTGCGYEDPMQRPSADEGMSPEQADFIALVKGMWEEMRNAGEEKRLWGLDESARVARSLDLFAEKIGDWEHGKRLAIKEEKLTGDERAAAIDMGHLTGQQLQVWTAFLKTRIGQEPTFDGVTVRFGDRVKEKRRTKFTVEVLSGAPGAAGSTVADPF